MKIRKFKLKEDSGIFPILNDRIFTLKKDRFGSNPKRCRFIDTSSNETLLEVNLISDTTAANTNQTNGVLTIRTLDGNSIELINAQ